MASEPPIGAHLISRRKGYTHHGICVGGGNVIHYSGLANGLNSGPVEEVNLKEFSGGNGFTVRTYTNGFSETKIVERARSRVGESSYSVFSQCVRARGPDGFGRMASHHPFAALGE